MKNLFFLFGSVLLLLSCTTQNSTAQNGKKTDSRLVGLWGGTEKDQQVKGMEKIWEMERRADGTFALDFTFIKDGDTAQTYETGKWWVENGRFYEYHDHSDKTDVYTFDVVDDKQIRFTSVQIAMEMNTPSYSFIDTKIGESVPVKGAAGTSISTAIKVNSIQEEYAYVAKNCSGCTPVSQALLMEKNNYYDKLTVKKPDGKIVNYYFNVTSFFGKGF